MICIKLEELEKLKSGMSDTEFSKKLGISRSQLWRAINERSSVGEAFIESLLRHFPEASFEDIFFIQDAPLTEQTDD